MRRTALVLTLLVPASAGAADVDVRYAAGRVSLKARAPLSEVLDKLSKQTGLKVVYDGSAPRTLVDVSLQGVTTRAAVLSLLDGLGLNYALQMDRTNTQATTLILLGSGAAGPRPPGSSAPAGGGIVNAADQDDEEIFDAEEEIVEDEVQEEPVQEEEVQKPEPPRPGGPQPWPGAGPLAPTFPGGQLTPYGTPPPNKGEDQEKQ
jgi:hypothetical protein